MGTYPRQDVLTTRAISLRSRVPGNWQARFWRPVKRGDPWLKLKKAAGAGFRGGPRHLPAPPAPQTPEETRGDPLPRAQSLTLAVPHLAVPGAPAEELTGVCAWSAVT